MCSHATGHTKAANAALLQQLPFADEQDFEDARCGFIAPIPNGEVIRNMEGKPIWDLTRFAFLREGTAAPETVNPSLWRQARLLMHAGLFKVIDGIYQVRTADISNVTFIEGDTGIIVVDPLTCVETARAALDSYYEHRPKKPVVAVVHTHSHIDHYGGVKGVVSEEDVKAGKVRIIAPQGFLKAALDENVMVGNVMSRRAYYMYGILLPPGPRGAVSCGLGVTVPAGTSTMIAPTDIISETGREMTLAGVTFQFQMAPDSEAPWRRSRARRRQRGPAPPRQSPLRPSRRGNGRSNTSACGQC